MTLHVVNLNAPEHRTPKWEGMTPDQIRADINELLYRAWIASEMPKSSATLQAYLKTKGKS